MEPPDYSERLTRAVCRTVCAVVGLSAVPPVLLPAESTRPLLRPLLAFVALGLVSSWARGCGIIAGSGAGAIGFEP